MPVTDIDCYYYYYQLLLLPLRATHISHPEQLIAKSMISVYLQVCYIRSECQLYLDDTALNQWLPTAFEAFDRKLTETQTLSTFSRHCSMRRSPSVCGRPSFNLHPWLLKQYHCDLRREEKSQRERLRQRHREIGRLRIATPQLFWQSGQPIISRPSRDYTSHLIRRSRNAWGRKPARKIAWICIGKLGGSRDY